MRYQLASLLFVIAAPRLASGQVAAHTAASAPTPSASAPVRVVQYDSTSWHPVRPTFALGSNTDGTTSVSFSLPITADTIPSAPTNEPHVTSWTIAPTASFSDNSKAPVVSLGGTSASPNFGLTSFAAGLALGYSVAAPLLAAEEVGVLVDLAPLKDKAVAACVARCTGTPAHEDEAFCKLAAVPNFDPASVDASQLCPAGLDTYKGLIDAERATKLTVANASIGKRRTQRLRFPELDLSIWGGVGASSFAFYQQQAAATGSSPATYGSSTVSEWHPSVAGAMSFTALPWIGDDPLGITFEIPIILRDAYQASKKLASSCSTLGTTSSTTTLDTCGSPAPTTAPTGSVVFTTKAFVGVIDRENAYWRIAVGAGYTHNSNDGSSLWSLELPIYINAAVLGGGKGAATGAAATSSAKSAVEVGYDGMIRVTPIVQYLSGSSSPGWSATLNLELLGQRNMFGRADSLVK